MIEQQRLSLNPRYVFSQFVVGESNSLAFQTAIEISRDMQGDCSPLIVTGNTGQGKTHLLQSIAWEVSSRKPVKKSIYLDANLTKSALTCKDRLSLKYSDFFYFTEKSIILLDDVDILCKDLNMRDNVSGAFKYIISEGHQLILGATLSGTVSEILSHLKIKHSTVKIDDPDYDIRYRILKNKRALNVNENVNDGIISLISEKIVSSIRNLEGAYNTLFTHSALVNKDITLEESKKIISDYIRFEERSLSIHAIQDCVADYYGISISDLTSANRQKKFTGPRHIAMYLSKEFSKKSLEQIGRQFGNRDHTTVRHAVLKIEELANTNTDTKADLIRLKEVLASKNYRKSDRALI